MRSYVTAPEWWYASLLLVAIALGRKYISPFSHILPDLFFTFLSWTSCRNPCLPDAHNRWRPLHGSRPRPHLHRSCRCDLRRDESGSDVERTSGVYWRCLIPRECACYEHVRFSFLFALKLVADVGGW